MKNTKTSAYSIVENPSQAISTLLKDNSFSHVAVLTDHNTLAHCYPLIEEALGNHKVITIPAGEEHKNLDTCQLVWEELTQFGFDRHSLLLVLGGGVPGDLGGFCAATYKRGINFVLMPTTLLAMVDAAVGGKLGIDFENYKNHIGVFANPLTTLISPVFLHTLPERELRSGFAEVVKHSLLSGPAAWNNIRAQDLAEQNWGEIIAASVAFKSSVVADDPKEMGLRKLLNLGHTIGHALESYYLASGERILHGEAVAMGILLESAIAHRRGMLPTLEMDQISAYIHKIFAPFPALPDPGPVVALMRQDKKNRGGEVLMALLAQIGEGVWDVAVKADEVLWSFEEWNNHLANSQGGM